MLFFCVCICVCVCFQLSPHCLPWPVAPLFPNNQGKCHDMTSSK